MEIIIFQTLTNTHTFCYCKLSSFIMLRCRWRSITLTKKFEPVFDRRILCSVHHGRSNRRLTTEEAFQDMAKAFDRLWHAGLIRIVSEIGYWKNKRPQAGKPQGQVV